MSQYLPTGNFSWMTDKEISKIDLGRYKKDGKKGLIPEMDIEYPRELHNTHNDYQVAPEKVKVSKNMLSRYCKKIAEKYKISIGQVKKLIPTLKSKEKYILHYRNLQLYLDLGLNLTKVHRQGSIYWGGVGGSFSPKGLSFPPKSFTEKKIYSYFK